MTGVLLALASAVLYGVADVWGGLLSRRADPVAVALLGQAGGLVCSVAAAPAVPSPDVAAGDLAWGALSGAGIGVQYLALAQAGEDSGVWPVAAGRVAAVLAIAPMMCSPGRRLPSGTVGLWSAVNGGLAAAALVCYLLATRQQLVVIAVVLSSLYPVVPVLLGVTALRERLSGTQAAGLAGAGAAVVLLTLAAA
ncbi:hypothetical protein [Actinomadura sp. NPDC000600]|uniref:hypothetical protein n=1 Tax=Actinomadura sp. NPDC000600 TaxID=3154262 RepID=UPI00339982B3